VREPGYFEIIRTTLQQWRQCPPGHAGQPGAGRAADGGFRQICRLRNYKRWVPTSIRSCRIRTISMPPADSR
jgi:hypothetical protein